MDFMPGYSSEEFAAYSVGPEVKLEGHMAWYPLPGHQNVYLKNPEENNRPTEMYLGGEYGVMRYSIGDMRLEVEGYPVPLYTGMKELERRPGYQRFEVQGTEQNVSLYGGKFWREIRLNQFPVMVVTTPYLEKTSKLMLRDLKKKHDYFAKSVGESVC